MPLPSSPPRCPAHQIKRPRRIKRQYRGEAEHPSTPALPAPPSCGLAGERQPARPAALAAGASQSTPALQLRAGARRCQPSKRLALQRTQPLLTHASSQTRLHFVGVHLQCQLAVGALDLGLICRARHLQQVVIVAAAGRGSRGGVGCRSWSAAGRTGGTAAARAATLAVAGGGWALTLQPEPAGPAARLPPAPLDAALGSLLPLGGEACGAGRRGGAAWQSGDW